MKKAQIWIFLLGALGFIILIWSIDTFTDNALLVGGLTGVGMMLLALVIIITKIQQEINGMTKPKKKKSKNSLLFTVTYKKEGKDCKLQFKHQSNLLTKIERLSKRNIKYNIDVKLNEK